MRVAVGPPKDNFSGVTAAGCFWSKILGGELCDKRRREKNLRQKREKTEHLLKREFLIDYSVTVENVTQSFRPQRKTFVVI